MIKSSLNFTYAGQSSSDFGILNISVDSGLYEESFIGSSSIIEQISRFRDNPYFIQKKLSPKTISLSFSLPENFTSEQLNNIARWLGSPSFYVPLYFEETPDKIYYCLLVSDSSVFHNGINGYLKLQFRCNSPYSYSPIYTTQMYDFSTNTINGNNITILNNGDIDMYSLITVQLINGEDFSIVNNTNGEKIAFTGISDNETITIETENEDISSWSFASTTNGIDSIMSFLLLGIPLPIETPIIADSVYRYDNMSSDSVFMTFPRGTNYITIFGNCKIKFGYEYRYLV